MSTEDTIPDLEERLRAALGARAELVGPEDLAPLPAPVVELRPAWRSPYALLATAAVVLLVLGVVLQGIGGERRSDDVAPRPDRPDRPQVTIPDDVGRDWGTSPESTPARVDLDGDGRVERVRFLAEDNGTFDGRIRLETTLSSTGAEAWGVADVGSTIGVSADGVVDADADGDQELVVNDVDVATDVFTPLVFDLRDGLLVQAPVEEPDLLLRGNRTVAGGVEGRYERYRVQQYWIEDGTLWSGRSVDTYSTNGESTTQPPATVLETWTWRLDDDGVLVAQAAACREQRFDVRPCGTAPADLVPDLTPATGTVGVGESATYASGYPFTAQVEDGDPARVVVEGSDGRTLAADLDLPDPRVATTQPSGLFGDGASLIVTSATDPSLVRVLVQREDRLVALEPVGEVALTDAGDTRTWLTADGSLVSAVAGESGTWRLWSWQVTSGDRVFAMPGVTVCVDDIDDPKSAEAC